MESVWICISFLVALVGCACTISLLPICCLINPGFTLVGPFPLSPPEEFNDKILCPELSDSETLMLHEEVKKIYETYCLDESIDKIRFDPFIVEEIKNSES